MSAPNPTPSVEDRALSPRVPQWAGGPFLLFTILLSPFPQDAQIHLLPLSPIGEPLAEEKGIGANASLKQIPGWGQGAQLGHLRAGPALPVTCPP